MHLSFLCNLLGITSRKIKNTGKSRYTFSYSWFNGNSSGDLPINSNFQSHLNIHFIDIVQLHSHIIKIKLEMNSYWDSQVCCPSLNLCLNFYNIVTSKSQKSYLLPLGGQNSSSPSVFRNYLGPSSMCVIYLARSS